MSNGAIGDVLGAVTNQVLPAAGPWGFAAAHWKLIIGGLGALAVGGYIATLKIELAHERAAHVRDAAQVVIDKAAFDRINAVATETTTRITANIARVAHEQEIINVTHAQALAHDRAVAATGYERLRATAAADKRRADSLGVALSAAREATCQAVAATNCDAIPAQMKAAQDNTDQLERVLDWNEAQSRVVNTPVPVVAE
jgi:hypothetical protein